MLKGFFKKASLDEEAASAPGNVSLTISPELGNLLNETVKLLSSAGLTKFAREAQSLMSELNRNRFTVAVVGEFSRGKSTFVNNLLGKDILPVGNLPTTAMLTRIKYGKSEKITVVNPIAKTKKVLPLSPSSWDGLVADMDGDDPVGVAFADVNCDWLRAGIEVIDTPGAGDLEEKRANIIGDALRGSDGAIIAISAEVAMSMSEKLFIEERLISKKTPFLMLIITKLDRIPEKQRDKVIGFVKAKLESWGMDIPVYVPGNVSVPGGEYDSIIGMDKVKNTINSWVVNPERTKLTRNWIVSKILNTIQSAINVLNEQSLLSGVSREDREKLIKEKKKLIDDAKKKWKELREQMNEKSDECYKLLAEKTSEFSSTLVEKLQYEISHNGNPQKWWKEDYPYRLKVEMTNLSSILEGHVSRVIATDLKWFNTVMESTFKTHVLYSPETIADKSVYTSFTVKDDIKVHDLSKAKTISRIGLSVLSIASFCACSKIGIPPIVGSTGIGTGGSIITENIFKNKIESQRNELKRAIAEIVPEVIVQAMEYSEKRVKNMYKDIITESLKQEKLWIDTQTDAMDAAASKGSETDSKTDAVAAALAEHSKKFGKFIIE